MAAGGGFDGSIRINTKLNTSGFDNGVKSMMASFKSLVKTAAMTFGVISLGKLGKEAIELASDIEEVDNVVSKSFGNLRNEMDDLANTAIKSLGMSRLTAYKTGSTFMSMGRSMLDSAEDAKNMALELTKLTGNMASFYNVSQDLASIALKSIYTGETETLKQYGVVMTEVNLKQFALSQGITKAYSSMSQSEKVMLRYKYVMSQLAFIGDDFLDTQDSWANQTRILKETWQEFLVVIGNGLKTVILPMVRGLNSMLSSLISISNVISSALSNIFGIATQKTESVTTNVEDASEAMDDFGDSVASAGKKVQKSLASFDSLETITAKTGTEGSSGTGAGLTINTDLLESETEGKSQIDKLKEQFNSLNDLGEYINEILIDSFKNIKWNDIFNKFRNFGKGLAEFLNGLISPELFGEVGTTIANSLNTAIYTALEFGKEFDFKEFGKSLASGLNKFFENFDFGALADTLNVWVDGLEDAIIGFLKEFSWADVIKGVDAFVNGLELDTIVFLIGAVMFKKGIIQGALGTVLKSILSTELALGIGTATMTLGTAITLIIPVAIISFDIGKAIGKMITGDNETYDEFTWFGDNGFFPKIKDSDFEELTNAFRLWGKDINDWMSEHFGEWAGVSIYDIGETFKNSEIFTSEYWSDKWQGFKDGVALVWELVKLWWDSTVVKQFWDKNITPLFEKQYWIDKFESLKIAFEETIKNAINSAIAKINTFITWLNEKLNISWDAFSILGKEIYPAGHIQLFTIPKIPQLANGAVIPGGNPFLAMLGDQPSGQVNIETPLDTMVDAFKTALADMGTKGNQQIMLNIDGQEFARLTLGDMLDEAQRQGYELAMNA